MTALAGLWSYRSSLDPQLSCERMLAAQSAFAPEPPGFAAGHDIVMGRRLFALLPEDRFDATPQRGSSGRWALVADVRLDNREELCERLGIAREEACARSDAAIVTLAFEQWEESAVERLAGDFALAAWDAALERLILARDFMGNRPLHYHRGAGFFAFSSMAKGVHALAEIPVVPNMEALRRFLLLVPGDGSECYFQGIASVPTGHLCVVTRDGVACRPHWQPSPEPLILKRPCDYHDAVREAMDRAVSVRLRGAERGVAAQLSGGLDSSTITATAARLLAPSGATLTAFSAVPRDGFAERLPFGRFADEGGHAAAVAALSPNIDHVLIRSGDRSPLASLDRSPVLFEQPLLNPCNGAWADAIADEAMRCGLGVLLTGQVGNFTFSYPGFERLAQLLGRGRLARLAREAGQLRQSGFRLRSTMAHAIGPFLPRPLRSLAERLRGRGIAPFERSMIAPSAAVAALVADLPAEPSADAFANRLRTLAPMDFGSLNKGRLAGWGIDTRDPTADRRLVELCLRIPMDQYLRGGRIRALARDAFADRLPPVILAETRKGLQAADGFEGFTRARHEAAEQVESLARIDAARDLLDIERMRRLVAAWPQGDWTSPLIQARYRLGLLRGLSAGRFLASTLG